MKTKMRLFSGILAIMMLFFAVTDYAVVAEAANKVTAVSDNGVSDNAVSSNTVVVKQKVDISGLFAAKHDKYAVAKANKKLAKVTKKGVLTAKKPGEVTVQAFDKATKKTVVEEVKITIVEVQTKAQKKVKATNKAEIVLNNLMNTKVAGSKFAWSEKDLAKLQKKNVVTVSDNTVSGNTVSGNTVSDNAVSGNYVDGQKLIINKSGKVKLTGIFTNDIAQAAHDKAVADAQATLSGKKLNKAIKKADKALVKSQAKYKVSISIKLPKFNAKKVKLKVNKAKQLKLKGATATAWYSTNPAVATVDNGKVTAVASGSCDVVAVADGFEYSVPVTVK